VFTCAPTGAESLMTGMPVTDVLVEVPDSDAQRERVRGWLSARPPLYRLYAEDDKAPIAEPESPGPWSLDQDVERALAAASLVRIEIVHVEERDGAFEVTLETTFTPHTYEHLEKRRAKLAFRCGDPRLLREGAVYLAPLMQEDWLAAGEALAGRSLFLVPGVLLPETAYALRVEDQVDRAVALLH
jgi:hypothetical protein